MACDAVVKTWHFMAAKSKLCNIGAAESKDPNRLIQLSVKAFLLILLLDSALFFSRQWRGARKKVVIHK